MVWEKLLDSVIGGIAAVASTYLQSFAGDNPFDKILYPVLGGTTFFFLLSIAAGLITRLNKKKFEGRWLEIVRKNNDLYLSRFRVEYRYLTGKHKITGSAYDSKGNFYSTWSSKWTDFDSENNTLSYIYIGTIPRSAEITGYANLTFQSSDKKGILTYGTGYLIDMNAPPTRLDFKFYKYSQELVKVTSPLKTEPLRN